MNKYVDIDIYGSGVFYLEAPTEKELSKFFKENREMITEGEEQQIRDVIVGDDEGQTFELDSHTYLIYVRNKGDEDAKLHELFHVTWWIINDHGVELGVNAEAGAYLQGYIGGKIKEN